MITFSIIPVSEGMIRLNPCCNGIYLMIVSIARYLLRILGLNPCCNGIYLMITPGLKAQQNSWAVLILVVMEYT